MDLGRTTTAYVSGYDLTRVHETNLVRGAQRRLVANFNGAIPAGSTIESATWRTNQNWAAILSNGAVDGRTTTVDLKAGWGGFSWVKVDVTLDTGEVYNQVFRIRVQTPPWFLGESYPASGPTEIVVTA